MAITKGKWKEDEAVLVRVHSVDRLTEMYNLALSKEPPVLESVLQRITKEGKGALILMRHSEKEKDVLSLVKSISQPSTEKEKERQRHNMTRKDYGTGAQILRALGISKLRLMTNSPYRKIGLGGYGLEVLENVPL